MGHPLKNDDNFLLALDSHQNQKLFPKSSPAHPKKREFQNPRSKSNMHPRNAKLCPILHLVSKYFPPLSAKKSYLDVEMFDLNCQLLLYKFVIVLRNQITRRGT